jgi:hypothetical protein
VGAAETLAAIRHSLVGVTETADLTEVHEFLQIADWQNQRAIPPLNFGAIILRVPLEYVSADLR